ELLQIIQLLPHAFERRALEHAVQTIEWRKPRRRLRIVETIHQQKINPVIPPVSRRRKRHRDLDAASIDRHTLLARRDGVGENFLYFGCGNGRWHVPSLER